MYQAVSGFLLLVRMYIGFKTIDNIVIFSDSIANAFLFEIISLYSILWFFSFFTVGIFYDRGDEPVLGSILYMIAWLIYLGLFMLIYFLLNWIGILPI